MSDNKSVVVRLSYDLVEKILAYKDFKAACYVRYSESNKGDDVYSKACSELAKIWEDKSLVEVISDIVDNSIPMEVVR